MDSSFQKDIYKVFSFTFIFRLRLKIDWRLRDKYLQKERSSFGDKSVGHHLNVS